MVAAWECRTRRQVVSVRRLGAGGIRSALRTRRIVDALARWPDGPMARWPSLSNALDPLVPLRGVLGGEPLDERGDLGADRRPARPVRVGPLLSDQAAVPPE